MILDANGAVVSSDVRGTVACNSRMSGMPDMTLIFTTCVQRRGTAANARRDRRDATRRTSTATALTTSMSRPPYRAPRCSPGVIDDCAFHPCVRYARWEREQVVSFVPPDGNFTLMTYRCVPLVRLVAAAAGFCCYMRRVAGLIVVLTRCRVSPTCLLRRPQRQRARARDAHLLPAAHQLALRQRPRVFRHRAQADGARRRRPGAHLYRRHLRRPRQRRRSRARRRRRRKRGGHPAHRVVPARHQECVASGAGWAGCAACEIAEYSRTSCPLKPIALATPVPPLSLSPGAQAWT